MTNDEINRRIAEIMEPMPNEPPQVYTMENASPGGMWWFDVMDDTGWQPLDFCADIAAAWRCVEWVEGKDSALFEMTLYASPTTGELGYVAIIEGKERWADTAPMAICIAFLAAFGNNQD